MNMKLIKNLIYAFKVAKWAYKNPQTMNADNFKMLSDLLGLILKVAKEHRHMMTHIAYIHPTEGEQKIVSIWAGSGVASSPTKRIEELLKEVSRLESLLSDRITAKEASKE